MNTADTRHWYRDYENVAVLVSYLAARGDSATSIAYAVEKPWKYDEEFRTAQAILTERAA